ncbi:restriction endonuclease subunit S [Pediococcus acidilactici]|uniref:restriction endonuclease subunit S n=1 Tax=Pediococcus acidilactici TaxID=1254 RepID=UPI00159C2854|nr:restriction endonuclease subunit S [Pediococcus acidilactici]NVM33531.1 restriction endonuclease subunit S [Pediococcus acidilactici]
MKDNQTKYPQLRFKGFTDPWEQRKLGELGSVAMNKRIFKEQTSDTGDVPFYKIGTFGGTPDAFISRDLFEEYKSKYQYPEVGDILISASGSIGRTVVYRGADEYFQDSNIVWLKHDSQLVNSFLKQFYSIVKWQGLEGSTIKRLYNKNILETPITLPSPEEQTKLGEFFEKLDNLIAANQRKLTKLKELKQGYLQKMFPKNGAKVPELRFAGFADDWEERKLKDVVEKQIKGKAQFEKLAPGEVEYLDTSRLNGGQAILTNGLKDVTLDDILILWDGSKAGTVYHGFEGALGSTLKAYRTSANSKFVYQYLKRHQDNIYNNYRTPNIPHVQKDFLNVFTISVPVSDEQEKIGSFFQQLDETIDLHQRKLDLLKEQKKGFLQKMFV